MALTFWFNDFNVEGLRGLMFLTLKINGPTDTDLYINKGHLYHRKYNKSNKNELSVFTFSLCLSILWRSLCSGRSCDRTWPRKAVISWGQFCWEPSQLDFIPRGGTRSKESVIRRASAKDLLSLLLFAFRWEILLQSSTIGYHCSI